MIGYDYGSVDENQAPDFSLLKKNGCSFVAIRGAFGYGTHTLTDPNLGRDRTPAHNAGLVVGSYLILDYPTATHTPMSPEDQAKVFIAAYGDRRPGELPVCLDVEFPHGRSATTLTAAQAIAWIERAYDVLIARYGVVMTYTSARVWAEDLDNLPSKLGQGPLWIKTAYAYKEHNLVHLECANTPIGELPVPWRGTDSPGVWIRQFQGDCKPVDGFTSTVDANVFVSQKDSLWIKKQLVRLHATSILDLQKKKSLTPDSVIGPRTFVELTNQA